MRNNNGNRTSSTEAMNIHAITILKLLINDGKYEKY